VRTITESPPNTGVDLHHLTGAPLSQEQMYVRCNFAVPSAPPEKFEVVVPGQGTRFLTSNDLETFQLVERDIVLECAGNGRTLMSPVPEGTPWDLDAVSPISVSGYRLTDVLGALPEDVVEVVFTGADSGTVDPEGHVPYQFSISRDLAMSPRPLLVTHIGGEPLDLLHGAPVRLVVPDHYAMISVKWLVRIEATETPFEGHFVKKYRYYGDDHEPEHAPVSEMAVRSVIAEPRNGVLVPAGTLVVSGSAWSGSSQVDKVEVSVDGGVNWEVATLSRASESLRPAVGWTLAIDARPGHLNIVARATDTSGATQPLRPRWNANGFANNVVQQVGVTVT
jgi:DMSO/TMAO reductase YedYZ molybdopterin-dependent catalytic subunit